MAAAPGNQYAARAAQFRSAINRALEMKSRAAGIQALDMIAADMIDAALDKESPIGERLQVWRELVDRLDGKPRQQTEVSGPDGGPIETKAITLDFSGRTVSAEA